MKTTGIITEYNPFHYGHLYHLQKSKKISGADNIICIMNGNFTQRGLPAITDKWSRTKMSLALGVDLVIELPLVFGIRSAQYFAKAAVKLLDATDLVENFVFGSESGKIAPLKKLAEFLNDEPAEYKKILKDNLKKGDPYPSARESALEKFFSSKDILNQIKSPNNILGIEYIRAILKNNLALIPLTIKRTADNYHSNLIKGEFASGRAIRKLIRKNDLSSVEDLIPRASFKIIKNELHQQKIPVKINRLGLPILAKLRTIEAEKLAEFAEITNGLENRFTKAALKSGNLAELISNIKTKSLTRTRIQRNLLHILLDLTEEEFKKIDKDGPSYLRVLGFNKKGRKILSRLSQNASLPIITRIPNYITEINTNSDNPIEKQLSYEIKADDLYSLLYRDPAFRKGRQDFYQKIISS